MQCVHKHVHKKDAMTSMTATKARRDFFDVVKGAADKQLIYRIHHRQGSVVLMSEEEYDSMVETLELLSIPGFRQSLKKSVAQMRKGETVSFEDVFSGKP